MNKVSNIDDTNEQITHLANKGFTIEQVPSGMTPLQAVLHFGVEREDWRVISDLRNNIILIAFPQKNTKS